MKTVRVQWYVEALVECPHCKEDNNFMEVDEFWTYSAPMENVKKFYHSVEITCEHCRKDFSVDGADY
jgi:phage FluMu protein Com